MYPLHACISLLLSVPISSNQNKCREGVHIIAVGCPISAYSLKPSPGFGAGGGGCHCLGWDSRLYGLSQHSNSDVW